jgi:AbrB family looped-hinge helix DNA binding protein
VESVYVTSKGQLVVPARLRRKYGIKAGTKICFIERNGEIVFRPITPAYIRSVCGMFKTDESQTEALLRDRAMDKKREEAKLAKFGSR